MNTLVSKIQNLAFKGIEGYNNKQLFFLPSEYDRLGMFNRKKLKNTLIILYMLFINKTKYKISSNNAPDTIFVFADDSCRSDLVDLFREVASLKDNKLVIERSPVKTWNANKKFEFNLKKIRHVFKWLKTMSNRGLEIHQKRIILKHLLEIFELEQILEQIDPKELKLGVVFFDAQPAHNFVVQYLKRKKIRTATMQHGVILAPHPELNNIDFLGIELTNSISDYFLAWNTFTYKQAIASNINKDKIKILGIPKCIRYENLEYKKQYQKVFGLVLNGAFSEEYNREMILIANKFCSKMNFKYILKFHPKFNGNEYDDIIQKENLIKKDLNGGNILDYCKSVKFSIVSNSTVAFELAYLDHQLFFYNARSKTNKFNEINHNNFTNIASLIKSYKTPDPSENLFEQLCTIKNIAESYTHFFKQVVN